MNLTFRIVLRISLLMSVLLAIWAILFYDRIINEVNDETDDSLELLSENLIEKVLLGEKFSNLVYCTNDTYYLDTLTQEQASITPHVEYSNEDFFVIQKDETEPSRVLRTIFKNVDGLYLRLTVAVPTVDTEDLNEAIVQWIITLYIALLIVITIVCLWVLWRTMKPLYSLLDWLNKYDISNNFEPLENPTKIKEFAVLNEAVMRSAKKSKQLYEQQEEFIGNASHEIQTPLAICSNRLDLLTETSLSEDQYLEISKIQKTISYISRLNKELLLLTKIDAGQFKEREDINLRDLIKKSLEDASIVYSYKNIKVTNNINDDIIVKMNGTLAGIMITNLIKNAFIHNTENGEINISFLDNTLFISNTSDESQLDERFIFNRFYQGSKKEGSTGLGLSLIKSVTKIYNYQLHYSFKNKFHIFSIKFYDFF